MSSPYRLAVVLFSLLLVTPAHAEPDARVMVELPAPMKAHMLQNMRGHLVVIDRLLLQLAEGRLDEAAELAEAELGMSSLDKHGASHIAPFYPEGMRQAGTRMHGAASRFSRTAQEGDAMAAYQALQQVTAACVGCHAGYRVQ
ncbi:cytochrome c [Sedimenticola hydrogenitrophicus]|uniref:cytochrome c n=1 Tax=Sedimenticola hydrogenitrophicus TaxID=2967975 RepID=UPI0023AEEDFB|nr:cytochrome c [Sedimenticola hydrogenitrophicus]